MSRTYYRAAWQGPGGWHYGPVRLDVAKARNDARRALEDNRMHSARVMTVDAPSRVRADSYLDVSIPCKTVAL